MTKLSERPDDAGGLSAKLHWPGPPRLLVLQALLLCQSSIKAAKQMTLSRRQSLLMLGGCCRQSEAEQAVEEQHPVLFCVCNRASSIASSGGEEAGTLAQKSTGASRTRSLRSTQAAGSRRCLHSEQLQGQSQRWPDQCPPAVAVKQQVKRCSRRTQTTRWKAACQLPLQLG